jgi:uncharacterized protein YndB with AHSA1/START domain
MKTELRAAPRELSKPSLTLERRLEASPAAVYAAWSDPAQLARWFGPDGGPVLSAETDVRVGGRYRIIFCTEDGEEHDVSGTYREVVPDEKLTFTWMWRTMPERVSLVTVALKGEGEGTLLTLTHEQFFDEGARDRHREGWAGTLDKLQRLFA